MAKCQSHQRIFVHPQAAAGGDAEGRRTAAQVEAWARGDRFRPARGVDMLK